MIINTPQSIQSNNQVDSVVSRRVDGASRTSNVDSEDQVAAEKQQIQQDEVVLRRLRARDREVRAHEGAHVAAGGDLIRGGPNFTLQRGPDGRSYAIGGEVQLDVSAVADDPEATLIKAGRIRNAALAPAEPSPQDRRVASNANELASRARVDMAVLRREEAALTEKQQTLDGASNDASDASGTDSGATNSNEITAPSPPPAASSGNFETQALQSNDVPAAAISAFMATAQTESAPVLFNQFV